MNEKDRVKSKLLFNEIISKRNKVSNKFFSIFFADKKESRSLFGISSPKKLGNAVKRNRLRRQVREILREEKILFKNKRNYIIIIKDACLNSDYNTKKDALKQLIGEINEK